MKEAALERVPLSEQLPYAMALCMGLIFSCFSMSTFGRGIQLK